MPLIKQKKALMSEPKLFTSSKGSAIVMRVEWKVYQIDLFVVLSRSTSNVSMTVAKNIKLKKYTGGALVVVAVCKMARCRQANALLVYKERKAKEQNFAHNQDEKEIDGEKKESNRKDQLGGYLNYDSTSRSWEQEGIKLNDDFK